MFYATQSPRGFANEVLVYEFSSRKARDEWVSRHSGDGDVNSLYRGAYRCTAKEARRLLTWKGDAVTQSYNDARDGDECLAREKRWDAEDEKLQRRLNAERASW